MSRLNGTEGMANGNEFLSDTVDGSEILQQLIGSLSHYLGKFYTSQVVQDF